MHLRCLLGSKRKAVNKFVSSRPKKDSLLHEVTWMPYTAGFNSKSSKAWEFMGNLYHKGNEKFLDGNLYCKYCLEDELSDSCE